MVAVLLSQRAMDKERTNKNGEIASQIICSRCRTNAPPLRKKIEELFESSCFVVLWRREDNSDQGVITESQGPDPRASKPPGLDLSNPKESPLAVRAFAGPMSPTQATLFVKQWTTPPSPHRSDDTESRKRVAEARKKLIEIRLTDNEKGLERIGRTQALEQGFGWDEYWQFLDDFANLRTVSGLDKLESYLKNRQVRADRDQSEIRHPGSPISNNNSNANDTVVSRNDSLNGLREDFENLTLSSPQNGTNSTHQDDFAIPGPSSESDPAGQFTPPHTHGNSTMPISFTLKSPDVMKLQTRPLAELSKDNGYRDNRLNLSDDWDSDDSFNSFYTAANSPPLDADMITPPSSPVLVPVFMAGSEPSKFDSDVLRALETSDVSLKSYPHISHWRKCVLNFNEDERKRWRTPLRARVYKPVAGLSGVVRHLSYWD